ncbi:MAG TPA: BlaI/MecI/CopY family transcriptional regulator [Candidatus Eremiobacteraceae bacterium]|nr:BlaI/MecI/CopY family transcriptional regulator [Candidatus Eremiobacteraceae bacterium]
MARKKSATLTEAELRLMDILWDKGRATVGDVVEALPGRAPLAYNTVLTTMRILEQKGYVRHNESGRAFVYAPIVDREQAQRSAVKQLVTRFFDNSPGLLALNVLENEKLDASEIDRLKRIIKASETAD